MVKPQEIVHKTARAEAAENFGEDRVDPPSVSEGRDEQIKARVEPVEKEEPVKLTSRAIAADKGMGLESRAASEVGDQSNQGGVQVVGHKPEEVNPLQTESAMNRQEVVHCTARAEATENLVEHESKPPSEQHM